ncbi:MAG: type IV secretion system DNA-binding domain-containing protein [Bacteroidetes bacterium]|nr:type IV secretion system DNA-binding domain-containing protein [Bacteroidota bacterium]
MTNSEYFTYQYYAWDYRCRGWHLEDMPVHLEPPYMPFIRHLPHISLVDDGKRHTIVSKAIEWISSKEEVKQEMVALDYEELELFPFNDEIEITALQIKVPKERNISPERMKALITMMSYDESPISFEIIGNAKEIVIQLVSNTERAYLINVNIKSYFPEFTVIESDKFLEGILKDDLPISVTDFGLAQETFRPISTSKNFTIDPLTGLFGALEHLQGDQYGGIQILYTSIQNSWSESIIRSVTLPNGSSFFADMPEAPKLAMEKVSSPLFAVCIRAFGQGSTIKESTFVLEAIGNSLLNASTGNTNALIPLNTESYDINARIKDIFLRQSHRLGMILNTDELVQLLHFPSSSIHSQKLFKGNRKTKEVPAIAKGKPFVFGTNYHNGKEEKVTIGIDERLKHTHIIGATGTGKSTLIANLIISDCNLGYGLVLFDPHGDLVDDVISHIPESRLNDIVLIDPSDSEYPIGLNILEAHSDTEKEILSSDLVASFRKLSTSWGDQMNSVFGNAIIAILESTEKGTLHDLRRFLVEKEFRNKFLQTVNDPSVKYYWQNEFPLLKSGSIGPILTRLDTFLRPRTIRNIVIQKTGLDFENLINSNKIVLVKLSQGLIGTENSYLLGSLILSKIHQAAFARQSKSNRNPFFIYLDEFQNFITPSIKEMLSGVRKYNVGLILSHQDLQQLQREDGELLNSVLSNTYTKIVFRIGEPDAKKLKDSFSSFDVSDLQNLGRGEAIIRIEQPQFDCSLDTVPLGNIEREFQEKRISKVVNHSHSLYGSERSEVEKILHDSLFVETKPQNISENKVPVAKKEEAKPDSPVVIKKMDEEIKEVPNEVAQQDVSTHLYLQTLVKKMAEVRGFVATLEAVTPDQTGSVDVLLLKDNTTIAIEICVTTDPQWEMHNIAKCLEAGYTMVISLCGDMKQLEKIKQKCITGIDDFESKHIHFFTPDALFSYLDTNTQVQSPTETIIKGYRVNVSYDSITPSEMNRKRASVAQVVLNSMKRIKKGKA